MGQDLGGVQMPSVACRVQTDRKEVKMQGKWLRAEAVVSGVPQGPFGGAGSFQIVLFL